MVREYNEEAPLDEKERSFEIIANDYHLFKQQQKQRFQNHIAKHNPALATAIAEESARFDVVRRQVIEPAMHEVADLAHARGYHVYVKIDDEMDRLVLIGTPSIRFYCSRQSFAKPVNDLIWSPSFIAFYGCPNVLRVQSFVEMLDSDRNFIQAEESLQLDYTDITRETIVTRLVAFVDSFRSVDGDQQGT